MAGLHVEWEERRIRCTLGVRHAFETGDTLPAFSTATADTLGAVGPGLEVEPLILGRNGQRGTAGGAIENRQTTGNRDATSERQVGTPRTAPSAATSSATATSTLSCDVEGNQQQDEDRADRQDLRKDHEQPVRDEETVRAGGDAPDQGAANLPRPRAAKVEGLRIPGRPVHIALRI